MGIIPSAENKLKSETLKNTEEYTKLIFQTHPTLINVHCSIYKCQDGEQSIEGHIHMKTHMLKHTLLFKNS